MAETAREVYGKFDTMVQEFDFAMEISKTVPEVVPAARQILHEAEESILKVERNRTLLGTEKLSMKQEIFKASVVKLEDSKSKIAGQHQGWSDKEYQKLLDKMSVPAGADLIRSKWSEVEDPLQRDMMLGDADDDTLAALVTAPRYPRKKGKTGYSLEPLVSKESMRREILKRNPDSAAQINGFERRVIDASYSHGMVVSILKQRTGGFGW